MTELMQQAIDTAIKLMQSSLEDPPAMAQGVHLTENDGIHLYAFDNDFFSDWSKKNQVALHILMALEKNGGAFAFVADAYYSKLPDGVRREDLPSDFGDWPEEYRGGCILVSCNQMGEKGEAVVIKYEQTEDGIKLSPPEVQGKFAGRFLFDLTERDMEKAILQALYKGREGVDSRQ